MSPHDDVLAHELEWLREFTPATRRAAASLPSLAGERLLAVCHLDLKMVPYFEALVGYGPVGRGAADAARHFGAVVEVCDVDPAARLAAGHLGFATPRLEEGLSRADVVFTATGRDGTVPAQALARCKRGAFLANLGHTNGELPVAALRGRVVAAPRPYVERCEVEGRTLYLLAGGAMFNLAAGPGDPYDTFDLITALLLEATGFLVTEGVDYPPGVHLLPKEVQDRAARHVPDKS